MSTITRYMSLTAWTSPADPYDHTELANNFNAIDRHRHVPGEGQQLVTDSYTDGSVTKDKLAEPAVDTTNLFDGSVTIEKLAGDVLSHLVPLGVVLAWWARNSSATPVYGPGTLFELCDGRTISNHDLGGGAIVLPNLIHKFIYFGVLAEMGVTGGSATVSLAHTHAIPAHAHPLRAHFHTVDAHAHSVPDHAHAIGPDGNHNHKWDQNHGKPGGQSLVDLAQRPMAAPNDPRRQSLYVPGFNEDDTSRSIPMGQAGQHNHGGATWGATAALGTGATAPNTGGAWGDGATQTGASFEGVTGPAQSAATDVRPPFVSLVPVVRVRNP